MLRILDESYTLLILPRRLATFAVSPRLLREVEARILHEAGLPMKTPPTWFHVHTEVGARGRPERVRRPLGAHPWVPLEVGTVMGLARTEVGFASGSRRAPRSRSSARMLGSGSWTKISMEKPSLRPQKTSSGARDERGT